MKHKTNIIIFALMLLSISASAQIQFTAGLNYESSVPSGAPSSTGSRIRVNLATGRAYIWNQAGSNWRVLAQGIDIVAGCSAPLYTPGYGQSLFAVNGCASPELYYYTGTAWVQISGAGGATYYAGEGIDITNDTISVDTVQRLSFRTDQTYSDGLGTLSWDNTNGTLQLGLKGGNVSLQLGQESVQLVKHADNTGLTKGKVVYLTGSSGGNLTVGYAQANSESTSANTFGVMTEGATGGNKGFCTTFGLVHNINTSNLTEGGMVWLSKDTAGAMTAVRPTAPNNGVEVGFCVTKHATNGVIFVTVQNGYELDELHNVYVPAPTNSQVLTYNTTNSRWEAATVADQSATNELQTIDTFSLSGQTLSASLSNDNQPAKTVTLPVTNVTAGTGISVSSATGNYTVTNSAPDQTVSISNGGGVGVTGSYPSFTLTATDQSVTNEIQRLDTFGLSGQTLRASLLNDGVAASSVTLPIVDVVAGTNVTVTKSNGVATVSATGGGGGGTPAGSNTQIQYNNSGSFGASSKLTWDNTNNNLAINGRILMLDPSGNQGTSINGNAGSTGIAIGQANGAQNSTATGGNSLAIGVSTIANAANSISIGPAHNNTGSYSTVIGSNITNTGANSLILSSQTSFANYATGAKIFGGGSSTLANSFVSATVENVFFGSGENKYSGTPTSYTIYGSSCCTGSNADTDGGNISLAAGRGMGAGSPGYINFSIAKTANTGIFQTLRNSMRIFGNTGNVLIQDGGSFLDNGYKLRVNATSSTQGTFLSGVGTGSTTYSLICTNSGATTQTAALAVRDDSRVGIRTNSIDTGAALEVDGTTGGILFPRLTTTERDALTPTNGLVIYNSTTDKLQVYAGGAWVDLH